MNVFVLQRVLNDPNHFPELGGIPCRNLYVLVRRAPDDCEPRISESALTISVGINWLKSQPELWERIQAAMMGRALDNPQELEPPF